MKKVLLLSAVAGLVAFTSCKKKPVEDAVVIETPANTETTVIQTPETTDVVTEAVEAATAAVPTAPTFESPELGKWATDLSTAAVAALTAAKSGDVTGLDNAQKTMTSLSESLTTSFKDNKEFAKAQEYYNSVKTVLETR